jgi:ABC-2 type transport system permease protein
MTSTSSISSTVISPTIVRLGVHGIFGRKRGILLFVLPTLLIGLAVLVRALVGQDDDATELTLYGLGLVVLVPLIALLATSGLLAPEIDDGSVSYLLAKPISRHTIVASKLVVAVACVLVFGALPMLVAGLVLRTDEPQVAVGFAIGSLLGGATYCAVFALLSVMTRHAVVIGLIYVLVWEGLLGGLLDGIRWLSVTRWSTEVVDNVADLSLVDDLPLAYAVIAMLAVAGVATWRTGWRLRAFNLTGDE